MTTTSLTSKICFDRPLTVNFKSQYCVPAPEERRLKLKCAGSFSLCVFISCLNRANYECKLYDRLLTVANDALSRGWRCSAVVAMTDSGQSRTLLLCMSTCCRLAPWYWASLVSEVRVQVACLPTGCESINLRSNTDKRRLCITYIGAHRTGSDESLYSSKVCTHVHMHERVSCQNAIQL